MDKLSITNNPSMTWVYWKYIMNLADYKKAFIKNKQTISSYAYELYMLEICPRIAILA